MTEEDFNIEKIINEAMETALRSRGIANIIIAGKPGTGKSTLINAVFQGRMAATGQGMPVTTHTKKITKKDVPVSIYDTRGIELKEYESIIDEFRNINEQQPKSG